MYIYIYIHIITTGVQNCANLVPKHSNHFVAICAFVLTNARPGEEACHLANQAKLVFSNLKDRSQGSLERRNGA